MKLPSRKDGLQCVPRHCAATTAMAAPAAPIERRKSMTYSSTIDEHVNRTVVFRGETVSCKPRNTPSIPKNMTLSVFPAIQTARYARAGPYAALSVARP